MKMMMHTYVESEREEGPAVYRTHPRGKVFALLSQKVSESSLSSLSQRRSARVLQWRFVFNLMLVITDAITYFLVMTVVLYMRHDPVFSLDRGKKTFVETIVYLVICSCIWILSVRISGAYHRHVLGDGYQLIAILVKASLVCWLGVLAMNDLLSSRFSVALATWTQILVLVVTILTRSCVRYIVLGERKKGKLSYPTVIVGSPEGIIRALGFLSKRSQLNYAPVAVCPIRVNAQTGMLESEPETAALREKLKHMHGKHIAMLTYGDHFAERVVRTGAQTVMLTDVLHRFSDDFNAFVLEMESMNLEMVLTSSAADIAGHSTQVRTVQGRSVLTVRLPQYSPGVRFGKRCFDLVVASVAVVLSSIITIPVAIAIKVTDGGPVFYKQTRIGCNGKPFKMIKFRSMVVNADALKPALAAETGQTDRFIFKMKDDPRVTKVGKFIRKYSIDELPQFPNVLKGDMSVVGPRPPLPEEYEQYEALYATRMLVKPGITGPWQVSGRSDLSQEESEALDVSYVQHWSVLGDSVIIMRTVGAVLQHKGAY